MKRARKRNRVWVWVIVAIGFGVVAYYGYVIYDTFQERSGRDLPAHPDLPAGASHIYFRRNFGYRCYVFDIEESAFRAWVEARGFVDKPVFHRDNHHILLRIDKGLTFDAEVTDGIVIQNDELPHGRTYWVVYDRENRRAYYEWMRD